MAALLYSSSNQLILHFGNGLVGSAVRNAILGRSQFDNLPFPFPWNSHKSEERFLALKTLRHLDIAKLAKDKASMHVVWSAGKAGFLCTKEEAFQEFETFKATIAGIDSFTESPLRNRLHFHLISSAGGIYEGARVVEPKTSPCPKRQYGELKLQQEDLVKSTFENFSIYRPSSVFSTIQPGKRRGLVPTLIWNTLTNQNTLIHGTLDTLRDYVWADDIGRFVAERIFDRAAFSSKETFILATAIPSAIFRVLRVIEETLQRPVPVRYVESHSNTLDITFSERSLPSTFRSIDLVTAVRLVYLRVLSDGLAGLGGA